ncbi:hypothetical protein NHQ30_003084 [Ciborinia camelliae]|nr:hypothetical protein NHQ30_003084 [Ciborinia camelliae]
MVRSGKGGIQGRPTPDLYAKEINDLYAGADKMLASAPLDIVPETLTDDATESLLMGYSESKFIAENVLSYSEESFSHMPISIARIGQLQDPSPPKESVTNDELDWMPIDLIADILVELIFGEREYQIERAKVCHLVNPVLVSWKPLLPTIIEATTPEQKNKPVPVPFPKWIDRVRKEADNLHSMVMLEKNSTIKLLSFYDGLAK